jgi:hypothetical protein
LLIKIKKKKHTDDDNNTTPNGEHACPAGYVVLDKPNKYGAFCEPKEGLPEPPKEKVVCKFPGQVGDDCYCPPGTEFGGFKGCIQKVFATYCGVETSGPGGDDPLILFKGICKDKGGEVMCIDCQDGGWGCCCGYELQATPRTTHQTLARSRRGSFSSRSMLSRRARCATIRAYAVMSSGSRGFFREPRPNPPSIQRKY